MKITKPPKHLSTESKKLWKSIVFEYLIEDSAGLQILQTALSSRDIAEEARRTIKTDGMMIDGATGKVRHPLLPVVRDHQNLFLKSMRHLNLDIEPGGKS